MRSRDLIDGVNYGEYMQRQMFCFGSDDGNDSGDSDSSYSGGLDFDEEFSGDYGPSTSGPSVGGDGGGGGGSDGGITAAQVDAMAKAQQDLFGGRAVTHGLSDSQIGYDPVTGMPRGLETVVAPGGQLVTTNLAGLTEAQRQGLPLSMEIAGLLGSDPYAYEIEPVSQNVIGQIGTPGMSLLGQGISAIQDIILGPPKTFEDLLARGAYTGMNAPIDGGRDGGSDDVRSVNPVTGRCDEGYIFDEDLQACRLDTRSGRETAPIAPPTPPAAPGTYARLGLLDVAPTGVSDFATRYGLGPQDFGAANLAYRRGAGTQFDIYRDPYQREGFTLLG
jgi:hypothetical protein